MDSNVKISFIDADSPVNLKMQKIELDGATYYYMDYDRSIYEIIKKLKKALVTSYEDGREKFEVKDAKFVDLDKALNKKVIAILLEGEEWLINFMKN